jgi:hypothetical protein
MSKKEKETQLPVYLVYSSWPLDDIRREIEKYPEGRCGPLRVIYNKEGGETNRTLAIFSPHVYDSMVEEGRGERNKDLYVAKYKLRKDNYPPKDASSDIFISIPKDLHRSSPEVTGLLERRLEALADWGILPSQSWKIEVFSRSREENLGRFCFIRFRKVHLDNLAMVKALLDDTYWRWDDSPVDERTLVCRCQWALRKNKG